MLHHHSRRSSCFWLLQQTTGRQWLYNLQLGHWTATTPLKNEPHTWNTNTNQGEMRNTRFPPPEVEPHSWQRWKEGESDEKHAGRRNRKEKGRNRSNWSRIVRLTINWSCIVEALARKTLLWRHAILKTKQGLKVYHKQSKYHYSVTKSVNVPRIWVRTSPPYMAINVWDVFAHWYVLAYITNISSATGFHRHTHCSALYYQQKEERRKSIQL